ncbi:hypothetical protein ABE099_13810 [Paenibacillus turicensis]|uniref:hypothetical protein n=1 Tax=Paenibacillus turicensis TaxID=160487 RepID=UPI003D2C2C70
MNDSRNRDGSGSEILNFSSIKLINNHTLVAAPLGRGLVKRTFHSDWEPMMEGLPEGTLINRLHVERDQLFASTNEGLYMWKNGEWVFNGLVLDCHQFRIREGGMLAATSCGLWRLDLAEDAYSQDDMLAGQHSSIHGVEGQGHQGNWEMIIRTSSVLYDFLFLRKYIVMALGQGLSLYNRYTRRWLDCDFGYAVTSVATSKNHVLGATDKGELVVVDLEGNCDRFIFDNIFIFAIVPSGDQLYVCTDRGLYKIVYWGGKIPNLVSVSLGSHVTDIDYDGENLYMATLFEGVKIIER